jgi:nickel-type superoxide dismutase maturation protease
MDTGFRQYPVGVIAIREGWMHWPLWRVAVAERSMEPTLWPGDWLLVLRAPPAARALAAGAASRTARRARITPGQIVIARHPGRPDMLLVKRAAWRQSGGWWLASDNPAAGAVDSRSFGPVPVELIEGRVLLRYWPIQRG